MADTPTTWADLLSRILTDDPGNVSAETIRALVNTTDRTLPRQLSMEFTGADSLIPDFVDTPGDESGEMVLNFGTASNADLDVVAGVVEVLNGSSKTISSVTISFTKTGGGGSHEIAVWLEVSVDSQVTWTPVANSARDFEIAPDGQGSHEILFSEDALTPTGAFFRMKISDITDGAGQVNIAKPVAKTGFRGAISGFAAKATFSYTLQQEIS